MTDEFKRVLCLVESFFQHSDGATKPKSVYATQSKRRPSWQSLEKPKETSLNDSGRSQTRL